MKEAEELRRLLDIEAIRDLARRYAHCVWQGDADGAVALFSEDGVMDTGDRAPLVGRENLRETYLRIFREQGLRPFVHNHVIDLQGDSATGTCYLDLRAFVEGGYRTGFGWYEDRYLRTPQGWCFASRRLHMQRYVAEIVPETDAR
jgi:ketosteroid isomerase-like protein